MATLRKGLPTPVGRGIYDYVRRRHASEFGLHGWKVTHAWTQYPETTEKLCAACRIETAVEDYREFLGKVEAVIMARDDFEIAFRDGAAVPRSRHAGLRGQAA